MRSPRARFTDARAGLGVAIPRVNARDLQRRLDVAREALREVGDDWRVVRVESGALERIMPRWREYEWGRGLAADLPVWHVVMVAGEINGEVLIDFVDGSVYGSVVGIAN